MVSGATTTQPLTTPRLTPHRPTGSRLAVSTTLLASLIAVCMRATSQIHALTGGLEAQRRLRDLLGARRACMPYASGNRASLSTHRRS